MVNASLAVAKHLNDQDSQCPDEALSKSDNLGRTFSFIEKLAATLYGNNRSDATLDPRDIVVNTILNNSNDDKHSLLAEIEKLVRPGHIVMMLEEIMTITMRRLENLILRDLNDRVLQLSKAGVDEPEGRPTGHALGDTEHLDGGLVVMPEFLKSCVAEPYQNSTMKSIQSLRCPITTVLEAESLEKLRDIIQHLSIALLVGSVLPSPTSNLPEKLTEPSLLCKLIALAVYKSITDDATSSVINLSFLLAQALDQACLKGAPLPLLASIAILLEYYVDTRYYGESDDRVALYTAISKLVLNSSKLERYKAVSRNILPRLISHNMMSFLVEALAREGLGGCQLPRRALALLLTCCESMRYPINELIQREMMRDNSHLKPSLVQLLLKERERYTQRAELNEQVSDYFKEPTEVTHMRRAHLIDRNTTTGEVVTVAIVRRRGVLLLPGLGSPEKAEFSRFIRPFTSILGVVLFDRAPQLMAVIRTSGTTAHYQLGISDTLLLLMIYLVVLVLDVRPVLSADGHNVELLVFDDETSAIEAARAIQDECSYRFAIVTESSLSRSAAYCLHLKSDSCVELITISPNGEDDNERQMALEVIVLSSTGKMAKLEFSREGLLSWPLEETSALHFMRSEVITEKNGGPAYPCHRVNNLLNLLIEVNLNDLAEVKFEGNCHVMLKLIGKTRLNVTFASANLRHRWMTSLARIIGRSFG